MESGKMKIKTETPENNMKMLQPLSRFDSLDLEFEKHIINETEKLKKLSDVRMIKSEEGINFDENQMLLQTNNDLWELKNQLLEKNRVVGAYQVHDETTLVKMKTEIEELMLQKHMDNQIIENLRRRILVLEEEIKTICRNVEEMKRREMEADREAKVIASGLLKVDETVKELRKELNVEDLKNKLVGARGIVSGIVSRASSNHEIIGINNDFDDDNDKGKHASSSPVCAKDHQTKKRKEISADCCHVHRRLSQRK